MFFGTWVGEADDGSVVVSSSNMNVSDNTVGGGYFHIGSTGAV